MSRMLMYRIGTPSDLAKTSFQQSETWNLFSVFLTYTFWLLYCLFVGVRLIISRLISTNSSQMHLVPPINSFSSFVNIDGLPRSTPIQGWNVIFLFRELHYFFEICRSNTNVFCFLSDKGKARKLWNHQFKKVPIGSWLSKYNRLYSHQSLSSTISF